MWLPAIGSADFCFCYHFMDLCCVAFSNIDWVWSAKEGGKVRLWFGPMCNIMPIVSQCQYASCSICQKTGSHCNPYPCPLHEELSRVTYIRIVTWRDPTLTLTQHIKSSLLWHIKILPQRAWCTRGVWHTGPCCIRHVTQRVDPVRL